MKSIFTIISFLFIATCSLAQNSPDSVLFTADHMSVDKKTGVTTYTGNVSFKNGNNSVVNADKVIFNKNTNELIAYSVKVSKLKGTVKAKNKKDNK